MLVSFFKTDQNFESLALDVGCLKPGIRDHIMLILALSEFCSLKEFGLHYCGSDDKVEEILHSIERTF